MAGVHVETVGLGDVGAERQAQRLVLAATCHLDEAPTIDESGLIGVPDAAREHCEAVLEAIANQVGVLNQGGRRVRSTMPCVAFVAEDSADERLLFSAVGLNQTPITVVQPSFSVPLDQFQPRWFSDRQSGVALLSDALLAESATGSYRDLILLFEAAFGAPHSKLEKVLWRFLCGNPMCVSRDEVRLWLEPRHSLSHADRDGPLPRESWIRKMLPRMEEAAFDLLLNKAIWRKREASRRAAWTPPAYTTSLRGDVCGVAGAEWGIRTHLFDHFGRYLVDLGAALSNLPTDWWMKSPPNPGPLPAK